LILAGFVFNPFKAKPAFLCLRSALGKTVRRLGPCTTRFYAGNPLKTRIPKAVQMELFRLKWTTSKTDAFPVETSRLQNSRFSG
jgi:hypothetical protein